MLTERHRPAARARDLPGRAARLQRPVRGAGLPGDRRSRRDPGRLRAGDVHQRGGRALERGDRASRSRRSRSASPAGAAAARCAVPADRPRARRPSCRASRSTTPSSSPRSSSTRPSPGAPPKSKFGYLFPSDRGALISIRLQPDVSEDDAPRGDRPDPHGRRRGAVRAPGRQLRDLRHPGVVQGLADELGSQIAAPVRRRAGRHGDRPAARLRPAAAAAAAR